MDHDRIAADHVTGTVLPGTCPPLPTGTIACGIFAVCEVMRLSQFPLSARLLKPVHSVGLIILRFILLDSALTTTSVG